MKLLPIELIRDIVFRLNDLTYIALGLQHPTLVHEHAIIRHNGGPGHLLTICLTQQDSNLRILRYLRTRFAAELTFDIALTKAIATGNVLAIKRVSLLWGNVRYCADAWITMAMFHAAWSTTEAMSRMEVVVNWLDTQSLTDQRIKNVYWIMRHQFDKIDNSIDTPLACLGLLERHPNQTWLADHLSDDILLMLYKIYADGLDHGPAGLTITNSMKEILSIAAHLGKISFLEQVIGQDPEILTTYQSYLIPKLVNGAYPVMAIRLVRAFHPEQKHAILDEFNYKLKRALMFKVEYLEDVFYLDEGRNMYKDWDTNLYARIAREDVESLKQELKYRRKQRDIVDMLVKAQKFHLFRPLGIPDVYPIDSWYPSFFHPDIVHQILRHQDETGLHLTPGSRGAIDWFHRANEDLRVYMLQRGLVPVHSHIISWSPLDFRNYVKWSRFLDYAPFIQPELESRVTSSGINGIGDNASGSTSNPLPYPATTKVDDYSQSFPVDQLPRKLLVDGPSVIKSCRLIDHLLAARCQLVRVQDPQLAARPVKTFGFAHDGQCWAPWYQSAMASRGQRNIEDLARASVLAIAVDPGLEGEGQQDNDDDDNGGDLAVLDQLAADLQALQPPPDLTRPAFHRHASSLFCLDPRVPAALWLKRHWRQDQHFHEWFKAMDTHLYCLYLENHLKI
ncbi:hypothetical protein BGZ73_000499 [Actinomortierella ambigua]|nr:hypothetical protein BGZ73_000499 [Actinomortierella ambigua]